VENDEVESHGQGHGTDQEQVGPWRHSDQRLIFRQAVHGVQHFNADKDGQSHGHWMRIMENVAIDSLEDFAVWGTLQVMSLE
jgi:hypothetical protein